MIIFIISLVKTSQDHINEIMMPDQTPKGSFDVNFTPQTEYWKKLIKIAKPLQKSKASNDFQSSVLQSLTKDNKAQTNKQNNNYIQLFAEELVQKEVVSILKKFLDSTEFMLKSGEKDTNTNPNASTISIVTFHTNLNLETQKYLQITRLYVSLTVALLARSKKEQLLGLQSLIVDLNIDNVKIAEFLRLFLIENDGLNILLWIMKSQISDFDIVQITSDILLSLNYNGAHYRAFIETISRDENIVVRYFIHILILLFSFSILSYFLIY